MEHPKAKGDRSTMTIILALHEAGLAVYLPYGENTRSDLILEDGDRIKRVQCKTGRLRNGAVVFAACSSYAHHRNARSARRDYHGQIDFFAVYCPQTSGVYLIPIEDLNVIAKGALRVERPRNNQKRGIRSAAAYQIGRVTIGPTQEPGAPSGA